MKFKPGLRLMSIDPGVDTGIGCHRAGNDIRSMRAWQKQYTHVGFVKELDANSPDAIICESFDHRAKDNINYTPVEFIGLVKWYAETMDIPVFFQTPSYGKSYFTADKLKKLGLYVAGKDHVDEMMAVRHMLMFLMNHDQLDLRLLR